MDYGTRPPGHASRDVERAGPQWRLAHGGPAFVWNGRTRGPEGARFELGWCSYCRGPAERGPSGAWFHLTPETCPAVNDLLGVLGLLPGQRDAEDQDQDPADEQGDPEAADQPGPPGSGGDAGHHEPEGDPASGVDAGRGGVGHGGS